MFAATRVMAAGKAGLESLPYFVDELLAQGITQLAPWAADHSGDQIEGLNEMVRERREGAWQTIYEIGDPDTKIGVPLTPADTAAQRLLHRVNRPAVASTQLADHPALLAALCRTDIQRYCRQTIDLWDRFKWENGISDGQQLAVVIPYCPEGPTSGTVGMYLGAALRKHFIDLHRGDELVVWGIELCPPINEDNTGKLDALALRNVFRGFVARQELLEGLPLTGNPDDSQRHRPFDITIVFDGGMSRTPFGDINELHQALDRAAAQTTACLLLGAAGGDVAESSNWLKGADESRGERWNAYMVHVVSERSYNRACRYLNYQVRLPWHRDREQWDKAKTAQQKEAFLRRVDTEIIPAWEKEKDSWVKDKVQSLVDLANKARAVKWDKSIAKTITRNDKTVDGILKEAVGADAYWYSEIQRPAPNNTTVRDEPFCVNIILPERLRRQAAEQMKDNETPSPISNFLGSSNNEIQQRIEEHFTQVLRRNDRLSPTADSQALFEQIIAIAITSQATEGNADFQPAREKMEDFLGPERRGRDGVFNSLTFNLPQWRQSGEEENDSNTEQRRGLSWRLKGVDFAVPVEYTFLTLARCRPQDGFMDTSTYDRLKAAHDEVTSDRRRWQEYAHYYGVKPPAAMLSATPDAPAEATSPNSSAETSPLKEPNGHQPAANFAEQQA